MVCDSVDAMLSDRPYRVALSIEQVREQLSEHAGRQFDISVVECVLSSRVLEEHVETVKLAAASTDIANTEVPRRGTGVGPRTSQRKMAVLN